MALIDKLTAIADAVRFKSGLKGKMSLSSMAAFIRCIVPGQYIRIGETINDNVYLIVCRSGPDDTNAHAVIYGSGRMAAQRRNIVGDSDVFNCGRYIVDAYISPGVTNISKNAFGCNAVSCNMMTSVTIPDTVTSIGKEAFYGCSGLTSIAIPNSVSSIGDNAFDRCSGLTSFTIPEGMQIIPYGVCMDCSGLENVTLPNTITKIGGYAFRNCSKLKNVTIPSAVSEIEGSAFENCSSLEFVRFESQTPPSIGFDAFARISSSCVFYVPNGCLSSYTSALNSLSREHSFVEY